MPSINNGRIHSFDVMRLIMSFLVVTIHVPFKIFGEEVIAFAKTAVPFFFFISGYFLYRDDISEMSARIIKQLRRILIVLVVSGVIYAIAGMARFYFETKSFEFIKGYFTPDKILDMLICNTPLFSQHRWFLGSFIYSLLILFLFTKTKILKKAMFIAPLLVAGNFLFSTFGGDNYYLYRNAIFMSLPYLLMGMLIRRYENRIVRIPKPYLWGLFLVLCVTNILELKYISPGIEYPLVSAELLVYVIVILCLKYKDFGEGTLVSVLGVKCSLLIYVLHIIPAMLMATFFSGTSGFVSNLAPVIVFLITLAISVLIKIRDFLPERKMQ